MKKALTIFLVVVVLGLCVYLNAFAAPNLRGNWVPFTTVEGKYVGQPKELRVYYDSDSLRINQGFAYVRIWIDDSQSFLGGHIDYVTFTKQYGVWVYQAESNRQALSYKYDRTMGRYQVNSSNIPPERITKGSVADKLFKTLYSSDGQVRKEISDLSEKNRKQAEEMHQASLKREEEKKRAEEEMRQARLKREEEDKKQAEENIKEAIRDEKVRSTISEGPPIIKIIELLKTYGQAYDLSIPNNPHMRVLKMSQDGIHTSWIIVKDSAKEELWWGIHRTDSISNLGMRIIQKSATINSAYLIKFNTNIFQIEESTPVSVEAAEQNSSLFLSDWGKAHHKYFVPFDRSGLKLPSF